MKRSAWIALCGVVFSVGSACAQLPSIFGGAPAEEMRDVKVPDFDVTTVKPHSEDDNNMMFRIMPGALRMQGVSLQQMILFAYGIKSEAYLSGGPDWMKSKRFDVEGKATGADVEAIQKLPPKQRGYVQRTMFRHLLEERFGLKTHIVTKEMPVYELVVAKGGPKMKEVPIPPDAQQPPKPGDKPQPRGMIRIGPGELTSDGMAMSILVDQLTSPTGRMVIDKTGLTGRYEIHLKWTPESAAMAGKDNGSDATTADIFTAIQEELGLKLVPAKGPVDTLVVDDAKLPAQD